MELKDNKNRAQTERYVRAQKKVDAIKGFYIHLLVYICVNLFISIKKIMRNMDNGETFQEAFFDIGTFIVWLAWGIGLAFHAFNVFVENGVLGKKWEEQKIKEYMEEEKRQDWY
ncbi:2TM domain-containing protein [Kordia periserrulae]|uniref:2TM domain-containing protein n=1 Tax=Kordia periserrulae TaxID=701523 RepID=A0A2T6C1E9_9FLAO|nr:2TM domain-containing protein [Kordia periserrulae]PTX62067.1 2TM domain-containing protein [Kordia periserrulae]